MKHARVIDHSTEQDRSDLRLVDVIEIPSGRDPEEFLSFIFAPNKEDWKRKGQWFIPTPDGVAPSGTSVKLAQDGTISSFHIPDPNTKT